MEICGKSFDFIRLANPDIIGLLEVDSGSYRTEKINQAEAIARELSIITSTSQNTPVIPWCRGPVSQQAGQRFLTNQEIKSHTFHT